MNSCRYAFSTRVLCAGFVLAAVSLFGALLPRARGEVRAESRAVQSKILGRAVRYSVILPPSYDKDKTRRYPVLYILHGLGDNEQGLLNSGAWQTIEQAEETGDIGECLMVIPDGGRTFYINSKDGRVRYEDFFIREFLPEVEHRYRALGTRAGRGISGVSMGGYGALRFAFKYPQLFTAVSAHMAALAEKLPADTQSEFGNGLSAFGNPFDEHFWEQNTPFTLLRESKGLGGLKIYFDCGQEDDYGFYEGAEALHEALKKRGIPHEFHLYPGGHNAQYVAAHFAESLRFQSRALGGKTGRVAESRKQQK